MTDRPPPSPPVPTGLRPGDTPSGIKWRRRIWLILPSQPSEFQSESIRQARAQLDNQAEVSVSEVRVKILRDSRGRGFPLLSRHEVSGIYRGAHRERTAVIAFGSAKVRLDISELPTNQGCKPLERFVRHKCWYALITRPEEVADALASALAWMDEIACEGPRDPRCLPMTVFAAAQDFTLGTSEDRREFIRRHKSSAKSSTLTDAVSRTWQVGPHHTRDALQVAGTALPIGFHWDVQAGHKSSVIATGWERWELAGGGYTNVHPDAYIRAGNATKTHPSATAERSTKAAKTPRGSRKGKGHR